jgi:hypothetical protein
MNLRTENFLRDRRYNTVPFAHPHAPLVSWITMKTIEYLLKFVLPPFYVKIHAV